MTPEEHQQEHIRLHQALDELLACFLLESFGQGPPMSIYNSIVDLTEWSHRKTLAPSSSEGRHYRNQPKVAQEDDPELLEWLAKAKERGGHFVAAMATAGLHADWENYPLIRTVLQVLRAKYPEYEPSDAVKQEIRNRGGKLYGHQQD
jgi:hypothetical protein